MSKWLSRKNLMELSCRTLGHTPEMAKEYLLIEEHVDRLWTMGERDFSWYDNPLYVYNCVNCFVDYSKGYSRWFANWVNEHLTWDGRRLNEVLDYGCGIGASSRLFREMTDIGVIAHYYGHWDEEPLQMKIGREVCSGVDRVVHVATTNPSKICWNWPIEAWDGVMAFEVFEHEYEPLALFDQLTQQQNTWILCESSSFTTDFKYGHFPEYKVDDRLVPRKEMPRAWRQSIEQRGWRLADSGWNSRPHLWIRDS